MSIGGYKITCIIIKGQTRKTIVEKKFSSF